MLLEYKGKKPRIGRNVFIAPNAVIVGDVEIGDGSSVWFGAVLRGDLASITIGQNTNIQDNCTVHVDRNIHAVIGDYVTIGHNSVIHGCTLESHSLVGINSCVLNGACVKTGTIVAAGSVVREFQEAGPFQLVAGAPAVLKKELPEEIKATLVSFAKTYMELGDDYLTGMNSENS